MATEVTNWIDGIVHDIKEAQGCGDGLEDTILIDEDVLHKIIEDHCIDIGLVIE